MNKARKAVTDKVLASLRDQAAFNVALRRPARVDWDTNTLQLDTDNGDATVRLIWCDSRSTKHVLRVVRGDQWTQVKFPRHAWEWLNGRRY